MYRFKTLWRWRRARRHACPGSTCEALLYTQVNNAGHKSGQSSAIRGVSRVHSLRNLHILRRHFKRWCVLRSSGFDWTPGRATVRVTRPELDSRARRPDDRRGPISRALFATTTQKGSAEGLGMNAVAKSYSVLQSAASSFLRGTSVPPNAPLSM
jgi:hypothetical protein